MHSAALPAGVAGVVLVAAVAHAGWNAIAHGIKDPVLAFGLIGAGAAAAAVPLAVLARFPAAGCWPYLLASVAIHVLYNLGLMRCYRFGEFGQVYPLARGISPLVVTVLAALFAAEYPSPPQVAGVAVISAGLAVLVFAGRRRGVTRPAGGPADRSTSGRAGHPGSRAAVLAAVGTGLAIASYTTVDGLGVRLSGSPAGYIGWLMALESLFVPAWVLVRHRVVLRTARRQTSAAGLGAGALSVLAYGLVLWAQTRGALAPVAALRETSVIFGAIVGTLVFREPFGRARIGATVLVAAGVLVLNLG